MLRRLGGLFDLGAIGERPDGQLLERFAARGGEGGESAFAALVERHGPMVWRVCRAGLRDPNDAEDAFQATFLVLVRRARSLWVRDSLGPWLHRVAHRVVARARRDASRRLDHERRAAESRPTTASHEPDDLAALLHDEIDRLPARCREPLILCDLQGLTHHEAARRLGCPLGTLKTRVARAREILRGRLSRRQGLSPGLLLADSRLAAILSDPAAPAAPLLESTIRSAAAVATGEAAAAKVVSAPVAALFKEALDAMFLTKLKVASAVVLSTVAVGIAGALAQSSGDKEAGPAPGAQRASAREKEPTASPRSKPSSRAMLIRRLEEQADRALTKLQRIRTTNRAFPVGTPAVDEARKEFAVAQLALEQIDRILADAVEAHPPLLKSSAVTPEPGDARDAEEPPGELDEAEAASTQRPPRRLSFLDADLMWSKAALEELEAHFAELKQPTVVTRQAVERAVEAKERAERARRMLLEGTGSRAELSSSLLNLTQELMLARPAVDGERKAQRRAAREAAVQIQREMRADLMRGTLSLDELEYILTKRPDATARRAVDRAQAARKQAESAGDLYTLGDLAPAQLEAEMTEFLQALKQAEAAVAAAHGTARRLAEEHGQDADRPPSPPKDGQSRQGAESGVRSYFDFMISLKY
jgi:RNA polymerase sigma factor (sigma-70 family)